MLSCAVVDLFLFFVLVFVSMFIGREIRARSEPSGRPPHSVAQPAVCEEKEGAARETSKVEGAGEHSHTCGSALVTKQCLRCEETACSQGPREDGRIDGQSERREGGRRRGGGGGGVGGRGGG